MIGNLEDLDSDGTRVKQVRIRVSDRRGDRVLVVDTLECIGKGSFGSVYSARAEGYPTIALKITTGKPSRLQQEIEVLSKVCTKGHLALPRFEFGALNGTGDLLVIGMELCLPNTLYDLLLGTRLSNVADRLFLGYQVAQAVSCVHAEGCIHRDIKLQNFVFDTSGNVKLIDFGLAATNMHPPPGDAVAGTVSFMSPEMAHNVLHRDKRVSVGSSADMWSLGIVLFSIFTQRNPYPSNVSSVRGEGNTTSTTRSPHNNDVSPGGTEQERNGSASCPSSHLATDASARMGDSSSVTHGRAEEDPTTTTGEGNALSGSSGSHSNSTNSGKQDKNSGAAAGKASSSSSSPSQTTASHDQADLLLRVEAGAWRWPAEEEGEGMEQIPMAIRGLIESLLSKNPADRPSIKTVLSNSVWNDRRRSPPSVVTAFLGAQDDLLASQDESFLMRAVAKAVVPAPLAENSSRARDRVRARLDGTREVASPAPDDRPTGVSSLVSSTAPQEGGAEGEAKTTSCSLDDQGPVVGRSLQGRTSLKVVTKEKVELDGVYPVTDIYDLRGGPQKARSTKTAATTIKELSEVIDREASRSMPQHGPISTVPARGAAERGSAPATAPLKSDTVEPNLDLKAEEEVKEVKENESMTSTAPPPAPTPLAVPKKGLGMTPLRVSPSSSAAAATAFQAPQRRMVAAASEGTEISSAPAAAPARAYTSPMPTSRMPKRPREREEEKEEEEHVENEEEEEKNEKKKEDADQSLTRGTTDYKLRVTSSSLSKPTHEHTTSTTSSRRTVHPDFGCHFREVAREEKATRTFLSDTLLQFLEWNCSRLQILVQEDQDRVHLAWLNGAQRETVDHPHRFGQVSRCATGKYRDGYVCDGCAYSFLPVSKKSKMLCYHCSCGRDLCLECFSVYEGKCTCPKCLKVLRNPQEMRAHISSRVCVARSAREKGKLSDVGGQRQQQTGGGSGRLAGKRARAEATTTTTLEQPAGTGPGIELKSATAGLSSSCSSSAPSPPPSQPPLSATRRRRNAQTEEARGGLARARATGSRNRRMPLAEDNDGVSSDNDDGDGDGGEACKEDLGTPRRRGAGVNRLSGPEELENRRHDPRQRHSKNSDTDAENDSPPRKKHESEEEKSVPREPRVTPRDLEQQPWKPFERLRQQQQEHQNHGLTMPTAEERESYLHGAWLQTYYVFPDVDNGDDKADALAYQIQTGRIGAIFFSSLFPLHSAILSLLERVFFVIDDVDPAELVDRTTTYSLMQAKADPHLDETLSLMQAIAAYDTNMRKQHRCPGTPSIYPSPRSNYTPEGEPFVYVRWFRRNQDRSIWVFLLSHGGMQAFINNGEYELRWVDSERVFRVRSNGVCDVITQDHPVFVQVEQLMYEDQPG